VALWVDEAMSLNIRIFYRFLRGKITEYPLPPLDANGAQVSTSLALIFKIS
jgi:hypothetical protein